MARVHAESLFALAPGFLDGARIHTGGRDQSLDPERVAEATVEVEERLHLDEAETAEAGNEDVNDAKPSKWTCGTCGLRFQNGDDQRAHFKSDFHRLNMKRKVAGKPSFSEEEFERFAGGETAGDTDVSSVSGSDSDVDDDERRRCRNISGKVSVPLLLNSGSIVEVWSCVVLNGNERLEKQKDGEPGTISEPVFLSRLKDLVSLPKVVWIVLLAVGGHFAGVVVDMKSGVVQAHQTYHRYVVRAKAGGKQANRDATGRAPKSAGASLRRYNEMALQKEIKGLLESWTGYLQEARCIFVFAPSRNSQSVFGDKPLLSREDDRVRSIPFPTRRPTYKEARRVYARLSSLQYKEKEEVLSLPEETTPVLPAKSEKKSAIQHKLISTNLDAAEEVTAPLPTPPLHEAVLADNAALVMELLSSGADPCVKHRGKTAYIAATSKEVRNSFRKFMASHMDMWDWNAANVPSPLTSEMEVAQAAKQAEKTAKRRAKDKERKTERKAQQKAAAAAAAAAAAEMSKPAKKAAPTQEAAMARERELRAAAAESRLKASMPGSGSSGLCSCCATSLANKVPFYKFEFRYCSVSCVNAHRRILEDMP